MFFKKNKLPTSDREICPKCQATGEYPEKGMKCGFCNGIGSVKQRKKKEILGSVTFPTIKSNSRRGKEITKQNKKEAIERLKRKKKDNT